MIKAQSQGLLESQSTLHFGIGAKRSGIEDFEEKSCSWDRKVGLQYGANGSNELSLRFFIYATH